MRNDAEGSPSRALTFRRAAAALVLLAVGLSTGSPGVAGEPGAGSRPKPLRIAYDQVNALVQAHRYAEAETLARTLLERTERAEGPRSLRTADALDALVLALYRADRSQDAETIRLAERAVVIKEEILGPDDLDVAFSLNGLSNVRHDRGEFALARQLEERVVAIREKILGPDDLEVGKALNNVAINVVRLGDYAAARSLYERVDRIFRSAGAREYPEQTTVMNNLSSLLKELGDYAAALPLLEKVLEIQTRALGPGASELAGTLGNLCDLRMKMGDKAQARSDCERSLALWEKDPGPVTDITAAALWNLSEVLVKSGDPAAARPLIERALTIRRTIGKLETFDSSGFYKTLGEIQSAEGDLAGARSSYERALAILSVNVPPDHPFFAEDRRALAGIFWRLGDIPHAWENALDAESIARDSVRQVASGSSEREAIQYERVRVSGLDLMLTILVSGRGSLASGPEARRAFDEVIRSRAMVLDEAAARHRVIEAAAGGGIGRLADALRLARNRLSHLLVAGPGAAGAGAYREQVAQARAERDRAERELVAHSPAFGRRASGERVGLREAGAALPPGSALVAYVRYDRVDDDAAGRAVPSYLAFVLPSGGTAPAIVPLGGAGGIDALVASWRREVSSNPAMRSAGPAQQSYRTAARTLGAAIWDPFKARLKDRRLIFIVPDGALHFVSFATLPDDGDGYLLETGPLFHYLSSERELVREPSSRGRGLLAIGGADFGVMRAAASPPSPADGSRTAGGRRPPRFAPLPGSLAEVDEIASLWPKRDEVRILTGANAGEDAFRKAAPGRRVIHLATHGFYLREGCEPACGEAEAPDTALLLSGLALAGANDGGAGTGDGADPDGILTAEEIASLDLTGVDWTVLSGCDTGLGTAMDGEGVLGLRRAFQIAGAGTLIMSLWPVEDEATRIWMRGLYRSGLSGKTTPAAAREAALAMIASQRERGGTTHPYYWGGFVAAGDWRSSPADPAVIEPVPGSPAPPRRRAPG